ncbi:hypothetical protein K438DRAFT_1654229, partial [Mycena galopus ATCC 62051]
QLQGESIDDEYFASRVANIEKEGAQQDKDALAMYGMLEGTDPRVARTPPDGHRWYHPGQPKQ